MSEPVITFPAPTLEALPTTSKWEREHRAFLTLLPELLKTHRGLYVAIHEGRIEDVDNNELALVERMLARLGSVSFHVGHVVESEEVNRIPHYRILQRQQP